ncbi:Autophagy protein 22 [Tulasnella sp. 403]|nr:Autophagy protein 22 [Tulasnella sp. 403]
MGCIADHPPHRKLLLTTFAAIGSISTALFLALPSTSPIWFLCTILAILANVSFGASIVALNAYLPALARSSPDVLAAKSEVERIREESGHQTPIVPDEVKAEHSAAIEHYNTMLSRTTSRISSQGIATGYAAGIALLLVALIPVTLLHGSTFSLRIAIGMSGIWWGVFTIPSVIWLPGGPHLIFGSKQTPREEEEDLLPESPQDSEPTQWSTWEEIKKAWKRLREMIKPSEMKKLRNTFWFLAAWFLLSDGFTTITSTAVLFAKTSLHMPATSLVLIGVITPMSGIAGSLLWPRLQRRLGWTNLHALVMLVLIAAIIPLYGCLGFVPYLRKARFGGLTTRGEMWFLAIYFGTGFSNQDQYMAHSRVTRGPFLQSSSLMVKRHGGELSIGVLGRA